MRFQLAINEACIIKEAFYDAKYGKRMLPLANLFDYDFHIFRHLNVRMNSLQNHSARIFMPKDFSIKLMIILILL